jgi:HSP20 family protein
MLVSYQRPVQSYPSVLDWVFNYEPQFAGPDTLEVKESPDGFSIAVDVPGVAPDDITLRIQDRRLNLVTKRLGVGEPMEKRYGWQLPRIADSEQVEATLSHGVLTVKVSKSEDCQPREVPIKFVQN